MRDSQKMFSHPGGSQPHQPKKQQEAISLLQKLNTNVLLLPSVKNL
jgi:hypothetical protein